MAIDKQIKQVIETLTELQGDTSIPKNVKLKVEGIIALLKGGTDLSIKVDKALNELDGIANDTNMQSYTRTQIWNIVSLLEKLAS